MAKRMYKVLRPWSGVSAGQIVELEKLHPSLKANVIPLTDDEAQLVPATPAAGTGGGQGGESGGGGGDGEGGQSDQGQPKAERRQIIAARLKELGIEFDGRKGADDLAPLLPAGELEKLFPSE